MPLYQLDEPVSCPKGDIYEGVFVREKRTRERREKKPPSNSHQTKVPGAACGFGAVVHLEFTIDVLEMLFDRAHGND